MLGAKVRLKPAKAFAAAAVSAGGYLDTGVLPSSNASRHHHRTNAEAVCAEIAALPEVETPILWRMVEILMAAVTLIVTMPLMLAVALIVTLDSPGPILFRQRRVGRGGRLFTFVKFRTFYVDARERFPHLYAYEYSDRDIETLCFKVPNDPRATRVGRWLRKSTLDELPNLWNVLTRDMALVGPRPEIPEMLPYYRPHELCKFSMRPGVTGLAQVSGRGLLSFRETADLDVSYVKSQSWLTDTRIVFLTIQRIVLRHGAF